jgi:hypothetical protein
MIRSGITRRLRRKLRIKSRSSLDCLIPEIWTRALMDRFDVPYFKNRRHRKRYYARKPRNQKELGSRPKGIWSLLAGMGGLGNAQTPTDEESS